jgi:uncharacterized cupredoxin-like copper-binding protein
MIGGERVCQMRSAATLFVLVAALLAPPPVIAGEAAGKSSANAQKARKQARGPMEQPFGRQGDPRKVKRVISIDMSDTMRFFPSEVSVKRGDTVRFEVRNIGELAHEMVIGTMDDLKKHAAHMKKNGEMHHADANAAHAAPGTSERIVWQFTKSGEFYYACLVPGHFDAGMIGTIVVR